MVHEAENKTIAKIEEFKLLAENLKKESNHPYGASCKKWHRDVEIFLEHTFGINSRHLKDFNKIQYSSPFGFGTASNNVNKFLNFSTVVDYTSERQDKETWVKGLSEVQAVFDSFIHEIKEYGLPQADQETSTIKVIENLLKRFHLVDLQLRHRCRQRPGIQINDEYDVQYLLHALLKIYFDDIRPEEPCPSDAGKIQEVIFCYPSNV